MPGGFSIGSLVRCRGREWIVQPSDNPDVLLLRGLGSDLETIGIYLPLRLDPVEPASFPLPDPNTAFDHASAQLLRNAARLSFRAGAGPFRSLGRISVRPRPYQFVPLLVGLRLETVRLLIADDVGVGKTIEGALLARELLDRGEATRLAVLCPPHLCEQWQKELAEKFQLDAVVIRSGTIAQLERRLPHGDTSVFEHYPYFVASLDFVKGERRSDAFVQHCPDLLIVDEAHTCARPAGRNVEQQQRHSLLSRLAEKPDRHIIMLTATPHSGVDESFQSLLGILRPDFAQLDLTLDREEDRVQLARHFVQRTRADIRRWLDCATPFPEREPADVPYTLSVRYRELFDRVYKFAREIVQSAETLTGFRQRVRYWTALALLRCVMSSPAAAVAALQARARRVAGEEGEAAIEEDLLDLVFDPTSRESDEDSAPASVVAEGEQTLGESEVRRLRDFARDAARLAEGDDEKLKKLTAVLESLLSEGYRPIVYCRFIQTSNYVADRLQQNTGGVWRNCRIISVTGERSEDERRQLVEELACSPCHILVATDCLSEGINLQEHFDAVIHYDLPWNPNRLDQREGRVDRFGQKRPVVKTVLLYGEDNPIDLAVLDVLVRKARKIYARLGISVPVPTNSVKVMEALAEYLFQMGRAPRQTALFDDLPAVKEMDVEWNRIADRERESRTRFAQRSIHPDEVAREIEESDRVLGDESAVEEFVRAALERVGAPMSKANGVWRFHAEPLRSRHPVLFGKLKDYHGQSFAFTLPVPDGARYIGRNHPITASLADYLLDLALDPDVKEPPATRCGAIRTNAVSNRTVLLLLRLRYRLQEKGALESLAEELLVNGFIPDEQGYSPLEPDVALKLMGAAPSGSISLDERRRSAQEAIAVVPSLTKPLEQLAKDRAERLREAHRRVRRITRESRLEVKPHLPVDILGVYVLVPEPKGKKVTTR